MRRRLPSSFWNDTTSLSVPSRITVHRTQGFPPGGRARAGILRVVDQHSLSSAHLNIAIEEHSSLVLCSDGAPRPSRHRAAPTYTPRRQLPVWVQERSGQSRVGHGITLLVAARAIQPLCGQHLSVTTSCGRSCPTAPGGCLPHVGRPVAACAATSCLAPIEWLLCLVL